MCLFAESPPDYIVAWFEQIIATRKEMTSLPRAKFQSFPALNCTVYLKI